MSKKKQLTGKKTKLAKLPLTKVLSQKMEEAQTWDPTPASAESDTRQLPLSWERLEEGAAGLLKGAYLLILQDLVNLQAEFAGVPGENPIPSETPVPADTPPVPQIKLALRQTREELSDLYLFLNP